MKGHMMSTANIPVTEKLLAVSRLPEVAQFALLKNQSIPFRRYLAVSPFLTADAALSCLKGQPGWIATKSLLKVADEKVLAKALNGKSITRAAHAARNSLADPDLLVKALNSPDRELSLAAFLNPSTPEAERRKRLTPDWAKYITHRGEPLSQTVVRANELVHANQWMLETPSIWPTQVRRGVAGHPAATKETLEGVRKGGWSGWKWFSSHPVLLDEKPLSDWRWDDLAQLGSPAADLYLVSHDKMGCSIMAMIATRTGRPPEPHVLARMFQRFGLNPFVHYSRNHLADTRVYAAAWLVPATEILYWGWPTLESSIAEINDLIKELGEDAKAWESLNVLLHGWSGTWPELAQTAKSL
jgi:hypothetical protein